MCGKKYWKLYTVFSYLDVVYLFTCILRCIVCIVVVVLCYCCHLICICCTVCIAVFTLDAGLLARSQYSEGLVTGHLDTGFSWFPCV